MCGLTVTIGKNISFNFHKSMSNDLDHRGPDFKKNLKINQNVYFSHNRLKIIDLSNNANQPMTKNNCHLVFNGMIYNYLEIKKDLEKFFYFKTNSDTEVILAAYIKWGKNCFKKFDGMFSIAIWDANIKKLIIARDRLGIKPLYYRIFNKNLYISSEVKPLLRLNKYSIDKQIVSNYFNYSSYEYKNKTFFKEIKQFLPSYIYEVNINIEITKKKYWCLYSLIKNEKNKKKISNINLAKELVAKEMSRILNTYSRSDKKISLLYSSGLDSNVLFELLNKNLKVISLLLTFGFKARGINDEISLLKKNLNIEHLKKKFTVSDFLENLDRVQLEQEMPWGGPNTYFQGELMNYSKIKSHNVSISADGADEIFGGYTKYQYPGKKKKFDLNYINRAIDNTLPYSQNILCDNFYTKKINSKIKCPSNNYIDNARFIDITVSKLPRNFRFSDRFSMNRSIELRYPFLDHKLIELSFKFSKNLFLNKKTNKILLRTIHNDFKKKKHINSPQTYWFYEKKFKNYVLDLKQKSPIYDFGLDKKKVNLYINNFYSKKNKNSFKMWQILNYHLWLKNFF